MSIVLSSFIYMQTMKNQSRLGITVVSLINPSTLCLLVFDSTVMFQVEGAVTLSLNKDHFVTAQLTCWKGLRNFNIIMIQSNPFER